MKKMISNLLIAVLVTTQVALAQNSQSLNHLVQKYDYQIQTASLSADEQQALMEKFSAEVKAFMADKSPAEILSNLNGMAEEMPEGEHKTKIQNIIHENASNPILAFEELNDLQLLSSAQAGDSANWDTDFDLNEWLVKNSVLAISAFVVGLAVAIIYTEKVKKKKNAILDGELEERNVPGTPAAGFSTTYYGSAEYQPSSYTECVLASPTVQSIIEQAKAKARAACQAQPKVNQTECATNEPGISLKWVGQTRCVATASLHVTIERVQ